jgi:hypothetical protein
MSSNASPPMGLSPTELDNYAQYAWYVGAFLYPLLLFSRRVDL